MTETRPCVCGDLVTADPENPYAGVVRHQQRSKLHRMWARGLRQCAGAGGSICPVMIPPDRERCRYCQRTLEMSGAAA